MASEHNASATDTNTQSAAPMNYKIDSLGGNYRIHSTLLKQWGVAQVKSYCSLYHLMQSWVLSNKFSMRPVDKFLPPKSNKAVANYINLVTQGVYAFLKGDKALPDLEIPKESAGHLRIEATIESRPFEVHPPSLRLIMMKACLAAMYFLSNYEEVRVTADTVVRALEVLEGKCSNGGLHMKFLPGSDRFMQAVNPCGEAAPYQQGLFHCALNCSGLVDRNNPIVNEKIPIRCRNKEKEGHSHSFIISTEAIAEGNPRLLLSTLSKKAAEQEFDSNRNLIYQLSNRIPQRDEDQALLAMAVLNETLGISDDQIRNGTSSLHIRRHRKKGKFVSTRNAVSERSAPDVTPVVTPPELPVGLNKGPQESDTADQDHKRQNSTIRICQICGGAPQRESVWAGPLIGISFCKQCTDSRTKLYSARNQWILRHLNLQQLRETTLEHSIASCLGKDEGVVSAAGVQVNGSTNQPTDNIHSEDTTTVVISSPEFLDGLMERCHYGSSFWPLAQCESSDAHADNLTNLIPGTIYLGQLQTIAVHAFHGTDVDLKISIAERWEGIVGRGIEVCKASLEDATISNSKVFGCRVAIHTEGSSGQTATRVCGTLLQSMNMVTAAPWPVVLDDGRSVALDISQVQDGILQYEKDLHLSLGAKLCAVQTLQSRLDHKWTDLLYLRDMVTQRCNQVPMHPCPHREWIHVAQHNRSLRNGNRKSCSCGELITRIAGRREGQDIRTAQEQGTETRSGGDCEIRGRGADDGSLISVAQENDLLELKDRMQNGLGKRLKMNTGTPRVGMIFCYHSNESAATVRLRKARRGRSRRRPKKKKKKKRCEQAQSSYCLPDTQYCPNLWVIVESQDSTIVPIERSSWKVVPLNGTGRSEVMQGHILLLCIQQFEDLCTESQLDVISRSPVHPAHLIEIARHHITWTQNAVCKHISNCKFGDEVAAISLLEAGRICSKPRKGVTQAARKRLETLGMGKAFGLPIRSCIDTMFRRHHCTTQPNRFLIVDDFPEELIHRLSAAELVMVQEYIHGDASIKWTAAELKAVSDAIRSQLKVLLTDGPGGSPASLLGAAAIRLNLLGEYYATKQQPWDAAIDSIESMVGGTIGSSSTELMKALEDLNKLDVEPLRSLRQEEQIASIKRST